MNMFLEHKKWEWNLCFCTCSLYSSSSSAGTQNIAVVLVISFLSNFTSICIFPVTYNYILQHSRTLFKEKLKKLHICSVLSTFIAHFCCRFSLMSYYSKQEVAIHIHCSNPQTNTNLADNILSLYWQWKYYHWVSSTMVVMLKILLV